MKGHFTEALVIALLVAAVAPFAWSYTTGVSFVTPPLPEALEARPIAEQEAWLQENRRREFGWGHLKGSARAVFALPVSSAIISTLAFAPAFALSLVILRRKQQ